MPPKKPTKNKDHFDFTDAEKSMLIEEVRARKSLWDSSDDDHKSRDGSNAHYESIGRYMSTTERTITGKFTHSVLIINERFRWKCQRWMA